MAVEATAAAVVDMAAEEDMAARAAMVSDICLPEAASSLD